MVTWITSLCLAGSEITFKYILLYIGAGRTFFNLFTYRHGMRKKLSKDKNQNQLLAWLGLACLAARQANFSVFLKNKFIYIDYSLFSTLHACMQQFSHKRKLNMDSSVQFSSVQFSQLLLLLQLCCIFDKSMYN